MSTEPSLRVLVVDDDALNQELMEAYLSLEGFTVLQAYNGVQALKQVAQTPPDMIILDVKLPDMSGYEVCAKLRAHESTRNIPILMISAYEGDTVEQQSLDAGANAFIHRPFESDDLFALLRQLLI